MRTVQPTLFRSAVLERGWGMVETFNVHFKKAAREVAKETGDPSLAHLTVLPRTFDRWMSGALGSLPQRGARVVLERMFSMPAADLFRSPPVRADSAPGQRLAPGGPDPVASPGTEIDSGDVALPLTVSPFGSAAPSRLLPPTGGLLLPADAGVSEIGRQDVRIIRSMLWALTESDHQFGGDHARLYAAEYLARTVQPRLHARMADPVRQEMFTTTAEFAVRVAWMHFDAGHHRQASSFMGLALATAQEAGDLSLTAWILAMRGLQEVWYGDAHKAVSYTSSAAALAGNEPGKARAFIIGKAALAMSLTGDRSATLGLLGQVRDAFESSGDSDGPAWAEIYDLAYLRDEEGNCFRHLGLGKEVVEAEAEAMRLRHSGKNDFNRLRAFSTSIQAIGYVQSGEIEEGCATAMELARSCRNFASRRVHDRLREVLEAVMPYGDVPAVRDLTEQARAALLPGDTSTRPVPGAV